MVVQDHATLTLLNSTCVPVNTNDLHLGQLTLVV